MSILIKGKKMPKCCVACWAAEICRYYDRFSNYERPEHCPLVEVPEPHGRLIDADKYLNKVKYEAEGMSDDYGDVFINCTDWVLGKEPTVIETEEQEHEI